MPAITAGSLNGCTKKPSIPGYERLRKTSSQVATGTLTASAPRRSIAASFVSGAVSGTTTVHDNELATLSVSFEAANKVYDATTHATIKASPAPSLVGVLGTDTVNLDGSSAVASFATKGVGTGHVSLEPSLLAAIKVSSVSYLQGQIGHRFPLGGDQQYRE